MGRGRRQRRDLDKEPVELPPQSRPLRHTPKRRTMAIIAVPLLAVTVAGYVGDAIMPTIVDRHPLLLIALSARNRNLILVANQLDPVSFYVVAALRMLLADPLWFLLGYWYGETAMRWAERRTRTFGQTLRLIERRFGKITYPLVLLAPNNWICLFAGAVGMSVATFAVLNVVGTFGRLYLIRVLGDTFDVYIDMILGLIQDYRPLALALTVGMVAVMIALEYRKGEGELATLSQMEEEMAQIDSELEGKDSRAAGAVAQSGADAEGDEGPGQR